VYVHMVNTATHCTFGLIKVVKKENLISPRVASKWYVYTQIKAYFCDKTEVNAA